MAENFDFFDFDKGEFASFRRQLKAQLEKGNKAAELTLRAAGRGLLVRGQQAIGFELDKSQLAAMMSYLAGLATIGRREVIGGLNHAALMWLRETQRHCPVDAGLLRESFKIAPASEAQGNVLEAAIGTNVPYAVYIEFGTKYIAWGQVKNWEPGESVIIFWPAKQRDLPNPSKHRPGSKVRARKELMLQAALSPATAEFMPPMRGSWQLIEDQIVQAIRQRLAIALARKAGAK